MMKIFFLFFRRSREKKCRCKSKISMFFFCSDKKKIVSLRTCGGEIHFERNTCLYTRWCVDLDFEKYKKRLSRRFERNGDEGG